MRVEDTIPIVIGVTGHRQIQESDRPAITSAVKAELAKLQALCPHSSLLMLSSLAEGGDLLCADAAEELNIPLAVALPRPREDYEHDFSEAARERFAHHCTRADQVFVAPRTEDLPAEGSGRNDQFRQAGIYVATHSHVLLALWDGARDAGTACGTAAAVDFAIQGDFLPADGLPLRSDGNTAVIHVFTPRGEQRSEAAGSIRILGSREAMLGILKKTDDFNLHAQRSELDSRSRLPEDATGDPVLERSENLSRMAGGLSRRYAHRYHRTLALLAVSSALLTFSFLMYDVLELLWMILGCGLMLLGAWFCLRYASRSDCHRRYLEYRALAECLRVQTYLRYAGSRVRTSNLLSWTQREETAWIMDALYALEIGPRAEQSHNIRDCWVEAQRRYHQEAGQRSKHMYDRSGRIVMAALIVSVALYLFAVLFELLCGGLAVSPRLSAENAESWRVILKLLLGTISAVTLFIANYYGRLALSRTLSDHRKMERFYTQMCRELDRYGQSETLLSAIAREELIENGNWCSYQRDNRPEISL